MNTYQACRRIKSILRSLRWDGTGDNVFSRDSVFVTLRPAFDSIDELRPPAAFVFPLAATSDESIPDLISQRIVVNVLVSVAGDKMGEAPLMGRNRLSATSNEGRGLLEIEAEVMAAIHELNVSDQLPIALKASSAPVPVLFEETAYHMRREYEFEVLLTTSPQFQHPRSVTTSDAGGTVTVSWDAPDDATNLTAYVVRRASGAIPVGFPEDGTSVTWTSGTSVADSPGSGTFTYSVFAAYDSAGGSLQHEFSDYTSSTVTV